MQVVFFIIEYGIVCFLCTRYVRIQRSDIILTPYAILVPNFVSVAHPLLS